MEGRGGEGDDGSIGDVVNEESIDWIMESLMHRKQNGLERHVLLRATATNWILHHWYRVNRRSIYEQALL